MGVLGRKSTVEEAAAVPDTAELMPEAPVVAEPAADEAVAQETGTQTSTSAAAHAIMAAAGAAATASGSSGEAPAPDNVADPHDTNLQSFYAMLPRAEFKPLQQSDFTKGQVLPGGDIYYGNEAVGQVRLCGWNRGPESARTRVAVKKIKRQAVLRNIGKEVRDKMIHFNKIAEELKPAIEDNYTEIGVYTLLMKQSDCSEWILRMFDCFFNEKFMWLVLDYAEEGDAFHLAGANLPEARLKVHMQQLLGAVQFLHKLHIGHRDIALDNILLKDGAFRLMDFGQAAATHSSLGTLLRYFCPCGKDYFRPPEAYNPSEEFIKVNAPQGAVEGSIVNLLYDGRLCNVRLCPGQAVVADQECDAQAWGYELPAADVYACGVCLFILVTGCPPWNHAILKDTNFKYTYVCGLDQMLEKAGLLVPDEILAFVKPLMAFDPDTRPSIQECLRHPWLRPTL